MDDTPDYMSVLEGVAESHGAKSSPASVGEMLKEKWAKFERLAEGEKFDLFISVHHDWRGIRQSMIDLVELLYHLPGVNWKDDVKTLREKDAEYGGSWHRRGGQGAFFMLARKWDRIEKQIAKWGDLANALDNDVREEGILDDLGDLRCYLLLVLSWHRAQDNPKPVAVPVPVHDSTEPSVESDPF